MLPSSVRVSMTTRDAVAVAKRADRAAGQRLRPDVADAGAGRDAGEARVGDERDWLADVEVLERRGDLVGLLHAGADRAAADEHHHRRPAWMRSSPLALDRGDRRALAW